VGLFAGCVQNFIYPDIPAAMASWFPHTEFIVPAGQCCCGLPALSAGAVEPAQRLIERNLKIFEELECDVILTGCASCSYMIRKWPEIVQPRSRTMAERAAACVREFTELAQNVDCSRPEPSVSGRVAFHAPCHSRFSSKGTAAAEIFLSKVLGDNFVEIDQGCCGHGGSFSINHAEISRSIFRERLDALGESGASTIVTTCSGCLLQWRSLASKLGPDALKVLHASEIGRWPHSM
jgi:glycolate oxidase iron-sulfur subunit